MPATSRSGGCERPAPGQRHRWLALEVEHDPSPFRAQHLREVIVAVDPLDGTCVPDSARLRVAVADRWLVLAQLGHDRWSPG